MNNDPADKRIMPTGKDQNPAAGKYQGNLKMCIINIDKRGKNVNATTIISQTGGIKFSIFDFILCTFKQMDVLIYKSFVQLTEF
jgi:hypothetical protein